MVMMIVSMFASWSRFAVVLSAVLVRVMMPAASAPALGLRGAARRVVARLSTTSLAGLVVGMRVVVTAAAAALLVVMMVVIGHVSLLSVSPFREWGQFA